MSKEAVEKRFIFHGNAVALAAHIRRPRDFFIPAVASSCLPVTGGLAEANSAGQSFDIISYDSASTKALGDFTDAERAAEFTRGNHGENELPTRTVVESAVKGFKIQAPGTAAGDSEKRRIFLAEDLQTQMESTSYRRGATEFRSLRVAIEGVSVDGYALKIGTDTELFTRNDTKEKLRKAYAEDRQFRKRYGKQFYSAGESSNAWLDWLFGAAKRIPQGKGLICATVVTTIQWEGKAAPGTQIKGNRLIVDGLGSIYFGEILIEEELRRLTLIRFQLGSPDGGDGSVCETSTNGHSWPPRVA